jgi:hypothetical protein
MRNASIRTTVLCRPLSRRFLEEGTGGVASDMNVLVCCRLD